MKRKPGQIVLDGIEWQLGGLSVLDGAEVKQDIAELRAWRRVIVACEKARISEDDEFGGYRPNFDDLSEERNVALAILRARKIATRRKP